MLRKARAIMDLALSETREAREQTNLALAESEESRMRAQAVERILTDAFRRSDPEQDGRERKAVTVLDRAADELARGQGETSAIRGALMLALAERYLGLGISEKAEPLLLQAYDVIKGGEPEIPASSRKLLADAGARIVSLYDAAGAKTKPTNGERGWRELPRRATRNAEVTEGPIASRFRRSTTRSAWFTEPAFARGSSAEC